MPTVATGSNRACTLTALQFAREGYPTVSVDNTTILLGCYDAPITTGDGGHLNTTAARVIARINYFGVVDTSLVITNIPNNMLTVSTLCEDLRVDLNCV